DGQHPRTECQERYRRRWMRRHLPILRIPAAPGAEQQDRHQPDPAAERVDDDAAREIVEFLTERLLEPRLDTVVLVPRDTLEERVQEADQHERRDQLRIELG